MQTRFFAFAALLMLGLPTSQAYAGTGSQLMALSPDKQNQYLRNVVDAIAQSFQTEDGATVRSNCVNGWYSKDIPGANAAIIRNAGKFPNEDPVRVAMAMLIRECGRDKAEGMQILRDRVARKTELLDEAARRAQAKAEAELADIERRAQTRP